MGPKQRPYLIDNHHLVRALHEEEVDHVLVRLVADLSTLPKPAFWTFMDNRNWLHPFDAAGKRKPLDATSEDDRRSCRRSLSLARRRACAGPAAMARTPRPIRSFSGPISCAARSMSRRWSAISRRRLCRRWLWRMARRPATFRDGAVRTNDRQGRAVGSMELELRGHCHPHQLGQASCLHLCHHAGAVRLHRARADVQLIGDGLVGKAAHHA